MWEKLGKLAYTTYVKNVNGVSVNGDQLPAWEGLSPTIQEAWCDAADDVRLEVESWSW